jgi:glutamine amidotransferase
MSVIIIDYGMGNLGSVRRALEDGGATVAVSDDPAVIRSADALILPGVGAFARGMQNLRERRLDLAMAEAIEEGRPLLGICLGMQLLADEGCEGGRTDGLGFISGTVEPMELAEPSVRIPHVGWNEIHLESCCPLTQDIPSGSDFYFVHSYHFRAADPATVVATTPYGTPFVSMVGRDRVFGTQFHPEKSSKAGAQLLRNFLELAQVPC